MPNVQTEGAQIFYTVDGADDAPAIVLSNSLGATSAMWEPQIAALSERFRVVRYDRRGHGQSESASGDYSIELLAREALAVMDAVGVERAHWCGLSIGGMTGLWLAAHHSDRIDRLVVASASTFLAPPELWNGRIKTAQNRGIEPLADPTMGMWFTKQFRASSSDAVKAVRDGFAQTTVDGFCGCCAAMRDMDLRETIRDIAAPTLVVVGAEDTGTPPADSALIVARVPDARGIILKASHILNVEQPNAFNRAVLDFLA